MRHLIMPSVIGALGHEPVVDITSQPVANPIGVADMIGIPRGPGASPTSAP